MNLINRITSPEAGPLTFMVACAIPIFFGMLVIFPPLAIGVAVLATIIVANSRSRTRSTRALAEAEHKRIWGF